MPPRGVKSQSRKNAAVSPRKSAAAPAPPRRSAQSQSNDIEPANNRRASAESQIELDSPARRTRSKAGAPGLSTVKEEVADQHEDVTDEPEAEREILNEASDVSSADSSEYLSHSQSLLESMDRESMIIDLPALFRDAKETLSLFDSLDPVLLNSLRDDLLNSASRKSKQLKSLLGHFNKSRETYRPKLNYIDVKLVIRGFAQVREFDEVPTGSWRPDAMLYMANLVNLVTTPFARNRDDEDVSSFLDSLYKAFPEQYAPDFSEAPPPILSFSTRHIQETAQTALEIRTQYAISLLYQMEDMVSTEIIFKTFFDPDMEKNSLRGFNLANDDDVLPRVFTPMYKKRIQEILSCCEGEEVNFVELENRFSWPDFVVTLTRWANWRKQELNAMIEAEGGARAIQRSLEGDEAEEEVEAPVEKQQHKTPAKTGKSSPRKSAARDSKKVNQGQQTRQRLAALREKRQSAASATESRGSTLADQAQEESKLPPSAQPITEIPQSPEYDTTPLAMGDEDDVPHSSPQRTQGIPPPSQTTRHILETLEKQRRTSNKENIDNTSRPKGRFNQRYPDAHKITADDTQLEQATLQPRKPNKRPAQTQDVDGEESDAFEEDTRQRKRSPAKRARHQEPMESPRRNRRGSRDSNNEIDTEQELVDRQLAESSQQLRSPLTPLRNPNAQNTNPRAQRSPTSPIRSRSQSQSLPPAGSQHEIVNRNAKLAVERFRRAQPVQPQTRKPWSVEETNRFILLIEEYGTSWANILERDRDHGDEPLLQSRTQVNLKDKARNIKMDYMKSDTDLPPKMMDIKLGPKYEEKLADYGVDVFAYERRQARRRRDIEAEQERQYQERLKRRGMRDRRGEDEEGEEEEEEEEEIEDE